MWDLTTETIKQCQCCQVINYRTINCHDNKKEGEY